MGFPPLASSRFSSYHTNAPTKVFSFDFFYRIPSPSESRLPIPEISNTIAIQKNAFHHLENVSLFVATFRNQRLCCTRGRDALGRRISRNSPFGIGKWNCLGACRRKGNRVDGFWWEILWSFCRRRNLTQVERRNAGWNTEQWIEIDFICSLNIYLEVEIQ